MSLGIASRPSLPLARRIAPAPSSLLDRVVVSATSPPRRRRRPDAPRPNASSWSQSCRRSRSIVSPQCRPFVAPRCTPGVVSAPAPAIARSRGCPPAPAVVAALAAAGRRCSLRRRRPGRASRPRPPVVRAEAASVRRRPVSSSHAPPLVVRAVGRCRRRRRHRHRCLRRRHRRRRHRRQHSRSRVALPLWSFASPSSGAVGHVRRYRSPVVIVSPRRPPPVAAVVVVDLSSPVVVLSHPAAGIADLGLGPGILVVVGSWLCSPPRCGRRRRRVLCSPPPVGSVSMARDAGDKT